MPQTVAANSPTDPGALPQVSGPADTDAGTSDSVNAPMKSILNFIAWIRSNMAKTSDLTLSWANQSLDITPTWSRQVRRAKDAAGNVWLDGDISYISAAQGTRLFTLPIGFRPANDLYRVVAALTSGLVTIKIEAATGYVTLAARTSGSTWDVYLDGLSFPTT
jgi:hypothetical protein